MRVLFFRHRIGFTQTIRAKLLSGEVVLKTIERPVLAFTGDTTMAGVLAQPVFLQCPLLIMEMTFLCDKANQTNKKKEEKRREEKKTYRSLNTNRPFDVLPFFFYFHFIFILFFFRFLSRWLRRKAIFTRTSLLPMQQRSCGLTGCCFVTSRSGDEFLKSCYFMIFFLSFFLLLLSFFLLLLLLPFFLFLKKFWSPCVCVCGHGGIAATQLGRCWTSLLAACRRV
jgi:hypothetical protein